MISRIMPLTRAVWRKQCAASPSQACPIARRRPAPRSRPAPRFRSRWRCRSRGCPSRCRTPPSGGTRSMDTAQPSPAARSAPRCGSRPRAARSNPQHEAPGQQEAGDDAGDEQLADRVVGERAVHDHVHARRDQDAQRAAGSQPAERARTRSRAFAARAVPPCRPSPRWPPTSPRSPRTARNCRCWCAAARPAAGQPGRQRDVHAIGDAGAQQHSPSSTNSGMEVSRFSFCTPQITRRIESMKAGRGRDAADDADRRRGPAIGIPMTSIASMARKAMKTMVIAFGN